MESGFHRSLNHSFRLMGFPPFNGKWFGMHGHYIYGNQNAVELYGRRAPFLARNLDELRGGHPAVARAIRLGAGSAGRLDARPGSLPDLHRRFQADRSADKSVRRNLGRPAVNEHGAHYFLPNIAISITHGTIYRLLHRLLQDGFWSGGGDALFDQLMACCETKTGTINKELFELAAMHPRANGTWRRS